MYHLLLLRRRSVAFSSRTFEGDKCLLPPPLTLSSTIYLCRRKLNTANKQEKINPHPAHAFDNNIHFLCEFVAISRYFSVAKQRLMHFSHRRIHWSVSDYATREYRHRIESTRVQKRENNNLRPNSFMSTVIPACICVINRINFLFLFGSDEHSHRFENSPKNTRAPYRSAIMRKGLSIHQQRKKTGFSLLYNLTPNSRLIDIDFLISLLCRNTTTALVEVVVNISNTLQCVTSHPIWMEKVFIFFSTKMTMVRW